MGSSCTKQSNVEESKLKPTEEKKPESKPSESKPTTTTIAEPVEKEKTEEVEAEKVTDMEESGLKKHVVIIEAEGGSDKGPDGHRKDTMPIVESLIANKWKAEAMFYSDDKQDELFEYISTNCDAYVSRINPGTLPNGEGQYMKFLRRLCDAGVVGMPHPDAMNNYGAKDALVKLNDTTMVTPDTYAYYTVEEFKQSFPKVLKNGERVLKQNRGSTGEGIWRVQVEDERDFGDVEAYPEDTLLKCTEAKDNHVEHRTLKDFMEFCEQYIVGENGMLIDMKFLPRIKEGEIRILMLHRRPINVVHKKPAESADAFSATLFSGAKYTYEEPDKWPKLIDMFLKNLDTITEKLGGYDLPLIWTADWILDTDENGEDTYILGEINCSCVGVTSQLSICKDVGEEIIQILNRKKL